MSVYINGCYGSDPYNTITELETLEEANEYLVNAEKDPTWIGWKLWASDHCDNLWAQMFGEF